MKHNKWIAWGIAGVASVGLAVAVTNAASRLTTVVVAPVVTRLDPITITDVPAVTSIAVPVEQTIVNDVALSVRPAPIPPRSPARPSPIIILPR